MQNALRILFVLLIVAIIGYSFAFVGAPGFQRGLSEDKLKLEDVKSIKCVIANHYYHRDKLPKNMDEIVSFREYYLDTVHHRRKYINCACYVSEYKPLVTLELERYEYKPGAGGAYQLCTNFNQGSETHKKHHRIYYGSEQKFNKGYHCFKTTLHPCKKKDR